METSDSLDDEFTLAPSERLKHLGFQNEQKKIFAAEIQSLTSTQSAGVSMVIAIKRDPQLVSRLQKRGFTIEEWEWKDFDLATPKGLRSSQEEII